MLATRLYRIGNKLHRMNIPGGAQIFKFLIRLICNCSIDPKTRIGENTTFAYGGIAVVIHKNCVIGRNVMISQCVTIGGRSGMRQVPRIGDNVYIGAGAIVLGDVTIGEHATIGAGSVVLDNVGPYEIWAGVPAKMKSRKRS